MIGAMSAYIVLLEQNGKIVIGDGTPMMMSTDNLLGVVFIAITFLTAINIIENAFMRYLAQRDNENEGRYKGPAS